MAYKKRWIPPDRFYDNYSISMHFGYSPEDEYKKIGYLIKEVGIRPTDENIRQSMDLINSFATEARRLCSEDIKKIDKHSRKERTVGGLVPTDISIAYEILRQMLEMTAYGIEIGTFCYLIYDRIKNKFGAQEEKAVTRIVNNRILNAVKKMTQDREVSNLILERYQNFSLTAAGRNVVRKSKKEGISIKLDSKKSRIKTREKKSRKKRIS